MTPANTSALAAESAEPDALSAARADAIATSFSRQGLMTSFGATLQRVERGEVEIAMPWSDGVTQQHGFFHGGVVGALADSACGYAALSMVGEGEAGLTAEYKINLLSPAQGERLVAVGRVLKPGRTLIVAQGEVYVEQAAQQGRRKQVATMLMTLCVVKTLDHV
ncbi:MULTISPECIES: PaaI family thioesterase [unclassified Cupriavidus]|uniref:PaaI family thioesterase n=1 Tax=unclassified Cupriavidus TaxID=2640874 RepID=UPI001054C24F|nr:MULTISPECIES: PaaI family thioesterase [unclassified Cupriavidus]MBF6987807.1 PaaI family thioesterase [Cupriavidus sp. IK-TO18]TDF65040.1 PaaI family thioesterase [Cupriavidus sp. L7L]